MPIEMRCAGCGQTLRVADEHAGKKARCPACGTIAEVPSAPGAEPISLVSDNPFAADSQTAPEANPFAERPEIERNPYASPSAPMISRTQIGRPHRGGLILTFGVVGVFCCMPLGVAAWVMGASDLKEIRAGRMDPSGENLTQVGMVLGIVSVGLAVLGFFANFGLVALRAIH